MLKGMLKKIFLLCTVYPILLIACSNRLPAENSVPGSHPTPTSNQLFVSQNQTISLDQAGEVPVTGAPTVASFFEVVPTNTLYPTVTPIITTEEAPLRIGVLENQPITITVYANTLNPNWRIINSRRTVVNADSTDFVHSGDHAVALKFNDDFETAYFAVSPDSTETYLRDNVLAVSFWLNGGKNALTTSDLGVTVFGSNTYPYWVAGDNSVTNVVDPVFSETRLYDLGINRTIPPDTWVKIEVWLDDIIYDPLYSFFTGFYIKNDQGFLNTIYIDDVTLLVQEDVLRTPRQTPETPTPQVTFTPTPGTR
jgi:hypothetical protein